MPKAYSRTEFSSGPSSLTDRVLLRTEISHGPSSPADRVHSYSLRLSRVSVCPRRLKHLNSNPVLILHHQSIYVLPRWGAHLILTDLMRTCPSLKLCRIDRVEITHHDHHASTNVWNWSPGLFVSSSTLKKTTTELRTSLFRGRN